MPHKTILHIPFSGQWFVMNGGNSADLNHHHGNKVQNYAFDFTKIDNAGKSYKGNGKRNENYFVFGQSIIAPADGKVIEVVDGVTDNQPGFGNYLAGAGNYAMIEHAPGEVSFMAHFQQGSIEVKREQQVKRGQKIGLAGNSGTSFAPHFHYHLQNSKPFVEYTSIYNPKDKSKGTFPTKIDFAEVAEGIQAYFTDVIVNNEREALYSPIRGDIIGSNE